MAIIVAYHSSVEETCCAHLVSFLCGPKYVLAYPLVMTDVSVCCLHVTMTAQVMDQTSTAVSTPKGI
jgi:hypothetical protein